MPPWLSVLMALLTLAAFGVLIVGVVLVAHARPGELVEDYRPGLDVENHVGDGMGEHPREAT